MLLHDVKSQQHIFLYELVYFWVVNVFLTCCARADTPPKTAPNRGPFVHLNVIYFMAQGTESIDCQILSLHQNRPWSNGAKIINKKRSLKHRVCCCDRSKKGFVLIISAWSGKQESICSESAHHQIVISDHMQGRRT
jgi:hypothetical protein